MYNPDVVLHLSRFEHLTAIHKRLVSHLEMLKGLCISPIFKKAQPFFFQTNCF